MRRRSRARNIIVRVATSVRPRASAISRPLKPWAAMSSAARASAGAGRVRRAGPRSPRDAGSRSRPAARRALPRDAEELLDDVMRRPRLVARLLHTRNSQALDVVGGAPGVDLLDEPQERLLDEIVGRVAVARHRVRERGKLLLMLLERLEDEGRFRRDRPGTFKRPQGRLGRVRQDGVIPHPRTTFDDSSCYPEAARRPGGGTAGRGRGRSDARGIIRGDARASVELCMRGVAGDLAIWVSWRHARAPAPRPRFRPMLAADVRRRRPGDHRRRLGRPNGVLQWAVDHPTPFPLVADEDGRALSGPASRPRTAASAGSGRSSSRSTGGGAGSGRRCRRRSSTSWSGATARRSS